MSALLITIHIIACIILIIAVLLQSGKSADLAGTFGGLGSQTVFGPRGAATLLSKTTTICAVLFMITSLGLWFTSSKGAKSVVKEEKEAVETAEPKKEPATQQAQPTEKKQEQAEKKTAEPEKKTPDTEKK